MRTNKGFLELRRLEAAREIANILATSGNRVMLDSQSLLLNGDYCSCFFLPFLNRFPNSYRRRRQGDPQGKEVALILSFNASAILC
jgi:hypothetical protein